MADVKISALPARTAVASTDILPVVDAAAGTPATQKATVAQVRAALMPVVLTADVSGVLPAGNQAAQTLAGDVTGTTAASVISGLAVSKLAPSGTNTQVLTTVGGVATWAAASGGYVAPTGTGYPHITGGAQDAAAVALTWTGDATGTGTGSSFALTVVKVNGASMPAAGALTTGNAAYVSGASALTYSALNLAGGAGWVTGVLPAGNQASQTMAGDVTGTTAASVVAKVNGTTYPAGGALTTGTIPRVTAAATVAYGALDLANASAVTGSLPAGNQASQTMAGDVTGTTAASVVAKINGASVIAAGALTTGHVLKVTSVSSTTYGFVADANVASGAAIAASKVVQATGTGFPHVTSGVLDAASIKVDVTNSAHVTVPATANGVVTSSGSVLQQAANVLAGSGFISIGATPSATGDVRMQGVSAIKAIRAGTDYNVLNISLGSFIDIGDSAGSEFISARPGAGGIFRVLSGAAAFEAFTVTETQVQAGYPIVGTINNTSPYSVHAKTTVATAGTHTMTATEYSPDAIMFSASTGGTYTFPLPATDAGAYYKTIIYTGNSSAVITNGGGAPKNVTVGPGTTMRCLFDTAGVHPLSGSAGAYP